MAQSVTGRSPIVAFTAATVRRLAAMCFTVWLVASLTFVAVAVVPGSYADAIDHPRMTPAAREEVRARLGLDQPILEQYLRWLKSVATGNLGSSYVTRRPVTEVLAGALPPTLILTASALAIDLVLGLWLAILAVRRHDSALDRTLGVLGLGLYGLPSFWVAGIAVMVFAVGLGWFPASHMHDVGASSWPLFARSIDLLHHLALPAACLGLVGAAGTARYLRSTLVEAHTSRYVLAARARGLPEWRILWLHALRPALGPVVTLLGLSLPFLVGGSVVIETIFAWPGMGRVLLTAAQARDVPVIMAVTLVGAIAVIIGSHVADLLYGLVDPRARTHE